MTSWAIGSTTSRGQYIHRQVGTTQGSVEQRQSAPLIMVLKRCKLGRTTSFRDSRPRSGDGAAASHHRPTTTSAQGTGEGIWPGPVYPRTPVRVGPTSSQLRCHWAEECLANLCCTNRPTTCRRMTLPQVCRILERPHCRERFALGRHFSGESGPSLCRMTDLFICVGRRSGLATGGPSAWDESDALLPGITPGCFGGP
jgi:hypothetical protein